MSETTKQEEATDFLGVPSATIKKLSFLHRHYPDGPDSVGPINQTLLEIESLLHTTIKDSLTKIYDTNERSDQRRKFLESAGLIAFAAVVAAMDSNRRLTALGFVSLLSLSIGCFLYGLFSLFETYERHKRFKQFPPVALETQQRGAELENMRNELSERCQQALHRALPLAKRIDRDEFDRVNQSVTSYLGQNVIAFAVQNSLLSRRRADWANSLYLLDNYYEITNHEEKSAIHAQFLQVVAEAGNEIGIQLPAETRSNTSVNDDALS